MSNNNPSGERQVVRVGVLGLGTVGSGVAEILDKHRGIISARAGVEIELSRALVRNKRRKRVGPAGEIALTTKASDIVGADDIDIVVELMGGMEPAFEYMTAALAAGQTVVTANKAIVAEHGSKLIKAAAKAKRDVHFEAAVAGGIPIIRTLREALASDQVTQITGILNGTTNYIVEAMANGRSYEAALSKAQELGFAEADPTLDVSGRDAADKLSILMGLSFGTSIRPSRIRTVGITELTQEMMEDAAGLGYALKLLASAERTQDGAVQAGVFPYFVPLGHELSAVPEAQNAIFVVSDSLGSTLYQGPGAGGLPTGSAVVADIIEAGRNVAGKSRGRLSVGGVKRGPKLASPADAVTAWYLRLCVIDEPGVLASITKLLADEGISLATVSQLPPVGPEAAVDIVLTTHKTREGGMSKALRRINKLRTVREAPKVVRIYDGQGASN